MGKPGSSSHIIITRIITKTLLPIESFDPELDKVTLPELVPEKLGLYIGCCTLAEVGAAEAVSLADSVNLKVSETVVFPVPTASDSEVDATI